MSHKDLISEYIRTNDSLRSWRNGNIRNLRPPSRQKPDYVPPGFVWLGDVPAIISEKVGTLVELDKIVSDVLRDALCTGDLPTLFGTNTEVQFNWANKVAPQILAEKFARTTFYAEALWHQVTMHGDFTSISDFIYVRTADLDKWLSFSDGDFKLPTGDAPDQDSPAARTSAPLKGKTKQFVELVLAQWPEQYHTLEKEKEFTGLVKTYTGMTREPLRGVLEDLAKNYKIPDRWFKPGPKSPSYEEIPEAELKRFCEEIVSKLAAQPE